MAVGTLRPPRSACSSEICHSTTRSDAAGYYRIDDAVPGRAYALALPSSVTSQDDDSAFSDLWKERFSAVESREEAAVAISPSAGRDRAHGLVSTESKAHSI